MREFELIDRVRARLAEAGVATGDRVAVGSGDDAAVIEAEGATAVSVDAVVEGVHFRRQTFPLEAVGRKALAAALSDLAATGASAGEALVVLGVPGDLDDAGAAELGAGLVAGAREWGVALIGGDVVAAPALFLSVTVLGRLDSAAEAIGRDGASPGEVVAVTGELGAAAAGLVLLERPQLAGELEPELAEALRARQLSPTPRLAAGRALAAAGATAMIDVSDGLGADARHLARASGCGIAIELPRLPLAAGVEQLAALAGIDALDLAAAGGEDYELLTTLPAGALESAAAALGELGTRLSAIGEVTATSGAVELREPTGGLREPRGHDQLGG